MPHPIYVKIFPGNDDTQGGEKAVSQMPKSLANEEEWPEVTQFTEGKGLMLGDDSRLQRGPGFCRETWKNEQPLLEECREQALNK